MKTGYLWNYFVCLGKTTINENQHQLEKRIDKSGVAVTCLLSGLLGLVYKLFVYNWNTSEVLFNYLYENKTYSVATVRKKRLKLPKPVTNEKSQLANIGPQDVPRMSQGRPPSTSPGRSLKILFDRPGDVRI